MKKLFLLFLFPLQLVAQTSSIEAIKKYPFPTELGGSATGSKVAWALNEQGKRNVYVADGPTDKARKLTNFTNDDGQEITSLAFSDDGNWLVFARGGDHGSNWDDNVPVNPSADPFPIDVKIISVPYKGQWGVLSHFETGLMTDKGLYTVRIYQYGMR